MAQPTVKTIQYLDPRIEPQPDPVYDYVIAPIQNQYYKIPASALSNSMLAFNNLTTLGEDRAYLDTFELEISATITFTPYQATACANHFCAPPGSWTFDSFPLNKCCSQARVNINGGGFYSQPMAYLRAKEHYMNQAELSKCYENICPIHRPILQTESGRNYAEECPDYYDIWRFCNVGQFIVRDITKAANANGDNMTITARAPAYPSRLGRAMNWTMQSQEGIMGGFNNQIVRLGKPVNGGGKIGYENYYIDTADGNKTVVKVTWREPVLCSPFSSKYDATYGRPLYNITSMDLTFDMPTLKPMIRMVNFVPRSIIAIESNGGAATADPISVKWTSMTSNYSIKIDSAQLCYQVMTIPKTIERPLTTLVPYRRFVPYITDFPNARNEDNATGISVNGQAVKVRSGVYTLNEIPTAIWMFLGPTQAILQSNEYCDYSDAATGTVTDVANINFAPQNNGPSVRCTIGDPTTGSNYAGILGALNMCKLRNWDDNFQFGYLKHVDITMANTTQILNQATPYDLYRIAKANGCEDSFWMWQSGAVTADIGTATASPLSAITPAGMLSSTTDATKDYYPLDHSTSAQIAPLYYGSGSVLRLKPGVDMLVPDQALIPGANARNMVFQASAEFEIPPHSLNRGHYAFWLIFEYVGVAAISPGQCEITMNPLGGGEVMSASPVMSATSQSTEGSLEGSGFWDIVKRASEIASRVANSGLISALLKLGPKDNEVLEDLKAKANKHGFGEPSAKRSRGGATPGGSCIGGAVIGRGLNDWV